MSLPGAGNGVTVLGFGLAGVALWQDTLSPLAHTAWTGEPLKITIPATGVLSLVGFVFLLVFVSGLSPDFADVAFWFLLALWAVYLVMNPGVVQTVAGWVSQGNPAVTTNSTQGTPPVPHQPQ